MRALVQTRSYAPFRRDNRRLVAVYLRRTGGTTWRKAHLSSSVLFLLGCLAETAGATELDFVPQEPAFSGAADEYKAIWDSEGDGIASALRMATGLSLSRGQSAIVCECVSYSGYRETPMQLRASYSEDTKRATLVHELSHRLISDVAPESVDQHQVIFLFVYDVWVQLWGRGLPMHKSLLKVGVGDSTTTNRHGETHSHLALLAGGSVGVPFSINGSNSSRCATLIGAAARLNCRVRRSYDARSPISSRSS